MSARELLERAYALSSEAETRALYRHWAATYDATMLEGLGYQTPRKTATLLADHLSGRDPRVLDVGSGTGLAGVELAALGFDRLDALDYSPEMLAVAESRGIYRRLIEADLTAPLAIADETYAALICTGTFTHAHVGAACLPELFRILTPGGLFACTVHKDVWREAGFEAQCRELEQRGVLTTRLRREGTYYSDSNEPEGWYIVWQKNDDGDNA